MKIKINANFFKFFKVEFTDKNPNISIFKRKSAKKIEKKMNSYDWVTENFTPYQTRIMAPYVYESKGELKTTTKKIDDSISLILSSVLACVFIVLAIGFMVLFKLGSFNLLNILGSCLAFGVSFCFCSEIGRCRLTMKFRKLSVNQ